jgi:short-chain Z-isoprenyl diphosphate synthase
MTAISIAAASVAVALVWRTRWRRHALGLGALFALAVGFSRLYLGVHYPSDVFAGWSLDVGWPGALAFARSADQRPRLRRARERMRSAVLATVYALYARRLRIQVRARQLPAHVAVILDGNRRWATSLGFADSSVGHRHGADKLDELIGWCRSLGIPEVTVWALSGENFERPAAELEALLEVIVAKLDQLASPSGRGQTKIRVIGRAEQLPKTVRRAVSRVEAATANATGLKLNIAVGYSGRDELVDACRSLVDQLAASGIAPAAIARHITNETLAEHLYTAGTRDPDLIIRTSGELRLSGFLPWQSAHSEFYFTDVYWPAFRELDFLRALRSYQGSKRRYGR